MRFINSMLSLGVFLDIPAMAAEVEKLSKHSPYLVSEVELISYLSQSNSIAKRISKINEQREHWLTWSRKITRPLTIKIADDKTSIFAKLAILTVIGLPMLVLTGPIRLFFHLRKWKINRDFCPYFIEWLKKHGVKK